jgi:RNA polymerase sigma-70 factor (ECF subfamily)
MGTNDWLTQQFEQSREHLRAVAYRMLGSLPEAEDAVQEAWLRLSRSDTHDVENLAGWLTTVTARVCLDMLRSRKSRREEELGEQVPAKAAATDPEREAVLADSVGLALLVVLDRLAPAERLAFVLHDLFGIGFEEIAPIVGRTPTAARQLASRARRRVHGAAEPPRPDLDSQRQAVSAFLTALRAGDIEGLIAVLDPDVVVHAEGREIRGARKWARGAIAFQRFARFVQPAIVDGNVGAILAPRGQLQRAMRIKFAKGKISVVDIIIEPERLAELDLTLLD